MDADMDADVDAAAVDTAEVDTTMEAGVVDTTTIMEAAVDTAVADMAEEDTAVEATERQGRRNRRKYIRRWMRRIGVSLG